MRLLYLDCFSGISGDMCLSTLLDLGVPLEILEQVVAQLEVDILLERKTVFRGGLQATHLRGKAVADQPAGRSVHSLREILHHSSLPAMLREQVDDALLRLAEAEARVHGADPEEVHFHEIGGLDTLLDLAGTFAAVSYLGVEQVQVSPLPLARGSIRTMHGLLPLPAPATLQLLKGVPTYGVPLEAELVTPTGAVLAVSLANSFGPPPLARWEQIGYGAGNTELPQQPNVLRAWLGETVAMAGTASEAAPATATATPGASFDEDLVLVLETQIDDLNPELLPYLRTQLEQAGAIDVLFTPAVMKKGRPGNLITVLSPQEKLLTLATILFRESSALGLRWYPAGRLKLFREIKEVFTPYGPIPIKIGYAQRPDGSREILNLAPEYEACARLAEETGTSLKDIYQAALGAALILLKS
ncbi:MAG: nickel pincer cofactor biosynthesis protein LarC [Thermacetogeniaceae bacterium]